VSQDTTHTVAAIDKLLVDEYTRVLEEMRGPTCNHDTGQKYVGNKWRCIRCNQVMS
jgi:hypothetical protein